MMVQDSGSMMILLLITGASMEEEEEKSSLRSVRDGIILRLNTSKVEVVPTSMLDIRVMILMILKFLLKSTSITEKTILQSLLTHQRLLTLPSQTQEDLILKTLISTLSKVPVHTQLLLHSFKELQLPEVD